VRYWGALKDRLLTDSRIDAAEQAVLDVVVGAGFEESASGHEEGVRRVCGVFLATPQFRLTGLPSADTPDRSSALVVPGTSFQAVCGALSQSIFDGDLDCTDGRARFP
jgi:hypothetical protein